MRNMDRRSSTLRLRIRLPLVLLILATVAAAADSGSHYESPVGYSLDYPSGWSMKVRRGVDVQFDAITFASEGGAHAANIEVGGAASLRPSKDVEAKLDLIASSESAGLGQTISLERFDRPDGRRGVVLRWRGGGRRGISWFGVSRPPDAGCDAGIVVSLKYQAAENDYSEELAQRVFVSFHETIAQTMCQRERQRR